MHSRCSLFLVCVLNCLRADYRLTNLVDYRLTNLVVLAL